MISTIRNRLYRLFEKYRLKANVFKNRRSRKILLLTTPPPFLRNLGDHAQVLGIKQWIESNFPGYDVLEFDKQEVIRWMPEIGAGIQEEDLVFLQSGGNLGDNGIWSERARRKVIQQLPDNKIVVLPQTVWFSDTPTGQRELSTTKEIYNAHPHLTVVARDPKSYQLAQDYFPSCRVDIAPDFVLYLFNSELVRKVIDESDRKSSILLILREDNESVIDDRQSRRLREIVDSLDEYQEYNTVIDRDIPRAKREEEVRQALELFLQSQIVITDRFHGLIFSVITRTPCIALESASHKITASKSWFSDCSSIVFCDDHKDIPTLYADLVSREPNIVDSWKENKFDSLANKLQESCYIEA